MTIRSELPRNTGTDGDGIAQTELDHFGNCPVCDALIELYVRSNTQEARRIFAHAQIGSAWRSAKKVGRAAQSGRHSNVMVLEPRQAHLWRAIAFGVKKNAAGGPQ